MDLRDRKALVGRFIERCNRYADAELERYRAELAQASGARAAELERKIAEWTTYRTFNEYTLRELRTTELDDWFD
ncbi:MAG: hypothetical protein JXB36_00350 [Gammaproteobacteria bacterium]|nr:hypothetical protein [Gammaproteobacteria bacterium]